MPKRKPKSEPPQDDGTFVSWEDATRPFPPTDDHEMGQVELSLVSMAQPPHTGDKALDALIIAGRSGIPAPAWAVTQVDLIRDDRITGKIDNLDIAFGYSTGTPKDSPVQQKLKSFAKQQVFLDIWRLTLLDYTVEKACDMAAARLLMEEGWNNTAYRLPWDRRSFKPRKTTYPHAVRDKLSATLNRDYYKWKKPLSASLQKDAAAVRTWLLANHEMYLKLFPALPKE